jgi:hypothetical protein
MAAAAGGGTLAASSPAPLSSHSCLSASSSSSAGVPSIATGHSSLKLKRQVWNHHSSRVRVFAAGTVQEGDKLSRPSSDGSCGVSVSRRQLVSVPMASICAYLLSNVFASERALASGFADMPALRGKDYGKTKMRYADYVQTDSGLQYKDLRPGAGPAPKIGSTVVVDWDGYTIGYYGRIFEARNKAKGGSFEGDQKGYFRFKLGSQEVIPAFEEAVATMQVGGVRRIIVPPDLGYPDNDYNRKGPQPTTFSGQRALDFVLRNQGLIDKTLLFDIELLKVADN